MKGNVFKIILFCITYLISTTLAIIASIYINNMLWSYDVSLFSMFGSILFLLIAIISLINILARKLLYFAFPEDTENILKHSSRLYLLTGIIVLVLMFFTMLTAQVTTPGIDSGGMMGLMQGAASLGILLVIAFIIVFTLIFGMVFLTVSFFLLRFSFKHPKLLNIVIAVSLILWGICMYNANGFQIRNTNNKLSKTYHEVLLYNSITEENK